MTANAAIAQGRFVRCVVVQALKVDASHMNDRFICCATANWSVRFWPTRDRRFDVQKGHYVAKRRNQS